MTSPIQIWTCAAFDTAYLCGGWASLRGGAGQAVGAAGGERRTTAARMALAGLAAGLRDLPPGGDIAIRTNSPELARFAPLLASLGRKAPAAPPDEDLDLWARIITAGAGRRLTLISTPLEPDTPLAFAAAIPKANLAKVAGLAG